MMTISKLRRQIGAIVAAVALAAIAAPVAAADDWWAYTSGDTATIPPPGSHSPAALGSSGPTDGLGRPLDPAAVPTDSAVRPDDRPGPRGPGGAPQETFVRPDDRPGPRGPGTAPDARPIVVVEQPGGFDWADAGIGAGAALGLVLLASGLSLVARRQRKASIPAL